MSIAFSSRIFVPMEQSQTETTEKQYAKAVASCREVFLKKTKDYGTAWRILRLPSLTDQLAIKGSRIRSIQEKGKSKVDEGVVPEFIGLYNYSVLALIQLNLGSDERLEIPFEECMELYDGEVKKTEELFEDKNHDYDEAWRKMRVSSITDLIMMKILRIKQIEDNSGQTLISEGVDANYRDIMNYAIFALILLSETE